jgi:hypothetical protein
MLLIIKKTVVGFEVSPHELTVLKWYLQILHQQEIQDQQIKQNGLLLETLEVGLLIKNATYPYILQYNNSHTHVKHIERLV